MSFYDDASLIFLAGAAAGKDGKAYNVKPVPKYGPELVVNGDFATDSDWNKEASWSISGGTANYSGVSNAIITQTNLLPQSTSATLKVQWTQTITSGTRLRFFARNHNDSSSSLTVVSVETTGDATYQSGNCNLSGTFTAIVTTTDGFSFKMLGEAGNVGSIDNVSVQEVLSPAGDFTFSRGSNLSATRVGPDGLIEKGRENVMRYSNQFTVSGRYSTSASTIELASNEIGYNGNSDVWELAENDATTSHWIRDNQDSITGVGTISVYAKYNGRHLQLRPTGIGSGVAYANFDLISGVKGTSDGPGYIDSTITRVGDTDWYRCSLTINHSGNYSWLAILVDSTSATELPSYPGDGTSGIYMQYAQLEIGLTATEYIESGASTGKAGLLEDEPRFDYSGGATCPSLLLEPSRTQLIKQSEYLSGYTLSNSSIETNSTTSPEGVSNATRLIEDTSTGEHRILYSTIVTSSGADYAYSFFVKANGRSKLRFYSFQFNNLTTIFDFVANNVISTTGGTSPNVKSESYGNDWYRVSISDTTTAANLAVNTMLVKDDNSFNYTGDGTSGVFLYGYQVEAGSYPTSYIPNHSGGTITRGVDAASTGDISSLVNSPEGTIFVESAKIQDFSLFQLDDGGQDNRITLYPRNNTTQITFILTIGGVQQIRLDPSPSGLDTTQFNKYAITWGLNDFRVYVNGVNIYTSNSNITFSSGALNDLDINIANHKQFLIFKEALSNADCTILTGTSYDTFADMAEALNYTVYE